MEVDEAVRPLRFSSLAVDDYVTQVVHIGSRKSDKGESHQAFISSIFQIQQESNRDERNSLD